MEGDEEPQHLLMIEPLIDRDQRMSSESALLRRSSINSTSQVALVGAKVCPIESLDYEIIENDFFKQDWRNGEKVEIFKYIFMKWTLCFLVGVMGGLVGFFINLAVENVAGTKFVITSNLMLDRKFMHAFGSFAAINLGLTLFSAIITAFISPAAAGSGIPEVKAYLNGVDAPGIFSVRTLVVKILGNISVVSASLYVGKAGPMVHTVSCIAALLSQGGSKKYRLTWRWLRFFKNDRDRRDLITCGSAAGLAAAFRAPVGGVLFALEEMASWWRSALLWRTFFTTAVVAVILRGLIDVCNSGKCGLFGKGGLIMFDVTSTNTSYHVADVPIVLLLGFIGGLLGSLYNSLLDKTLRVYNYINNKGRAQKIILACTICVVTTFLLFGLPWVSKCKPCPADASEACPTIGRSGNYKNKNTDAEFQPTSLLIFFVTNYFLGILSYGIAAPTGLFVPIILTGASYGRFIGRLSGSRTSLNHGLFAVLGAASFLGGTMRMTVSLCVVLLEITNNLLLLPLVMLVLLVSKTVADMFNNNIYDIIMKLKGFPYLEAHAEPYMRQLTVSDVVKGPLQSFDGIEKVQNIVHVLKTTGHNGFPVIDGPPFSDYRAWFGLILREHILVLLRKKNFLSVPQPTGTDAFKQLSSDDFAKKGSGKADKIEDIEITEEEMEMFIDLHPFTNASPYTAGETMSLAKALLMFREAGLRHLLVVPKDSGLKGKPCSLCIALRVPLTVHVAAVTYAEAACRGNSN
ncbi:hypothetical protein Syun_011163 [Stephania yunnanensis]|uniref:Chloride channel protein n=1 Tax=Stephania yunnanensis TaxID=152371 RepID=A0AAP0JX06_9MAGN